MTENQKRLLERKQQKKQDILNRLNKSKQDTQLLLKYEKIKIHTSLNNELINLIDKQTHNRSDLIENLLIKYLEERLNKKIVISKYQGL